MKHVGGDVECTHMGLRRKTLPGHSDSNKDSGGSDREEREKRGADQALGMSPLDVPAVLYFLLGLL